MDISARPRGQIGQWNLTADDGTQIIFTSFIGIEFRDNAKVSEEALEQGTFTSYNKTESSAQAYVTLGMSAAIESEWVDIAAMIDNLQKLKKNPTKMTVVTPEHVLQNMTLEAWNYNRQAEDGVGVVYVELALREVREIGDVSLAGGGYSSSQVKNPNGASTANRGTVNAQQDESALFKLFNR